MLPLKPQRNDRSDFENVFFEDSEMDDLIQIIRSVFDMSDQIRMEEIEYAFEKLRERMANEHVDSRQSAL
jgi:hypothetical protein